jgi:hypothetical protein
VKTVKLQGGLGNQLFGLAFARSVARLAGGRVALDLGAFASDRHGRVFDLRDLAEGLGDVGFVRRPLLGGRLATALARLVAPPGYVSEGAPPADEAALADLIARGRYFNGYWQHEAFIADPEAFIAAVRRSAFERAAATPVREVVIPYRTYKEERRPAARRVPGGDYVRAALARIEARMGSAAEIALVSDDPALAMDRLGDLGRPVSVLTTGGPWDDMALLMHARALVLSNSSFSWWGGFCGDAQAAIYPRHDGYFHYPVPAARFECV